MLLQNCLLFASITKLGRLKVENLTKTGSTGSHL